VLRPLLLFPLIAAAILGPIEVARAADRQKQVLVVYSTRRNAEVVVVGDRELPRLLTAGVGQEVDYYSEHLDVSRFPDPDYQDTFSSFLATKYQGHRFDVIVAMQDVAIEFLEHARNTVFPGTPIVYFSASPSTPRLANSTGVIAEVDLRATVTLAAALQPDLRQVFVVSGAQRGDQAYETMARAQLPSFEPRLTITYLNGLPSGQLEARLRALPSHSIVLFLIVTLDAKGDTFLPLDYVDRVTATANVPTYCWIDSAMNHGIVGGSLRSQEAQMKAIAEQALRVLKGEPADTIPLLKPDLSVPQLDWRQLKRWGINDARIPTGTLVRYRDPSVWDRYRGYIVGAAVLVLAQATLIAGLLLQADRRRQAEKRLRSSQEQLRTSFDRIRDLGRRLLAAQEEEHSRLARELHDDVSQQLSVLSIDLEMMSHGGPDRQTDRERLAHHALDCAEGVARSLRNLSHRLHPASLRLTGVVPALGGLQRDLSTAETAITFTHEDAAVALPQDVALCLFRVAQEALRNAIKHSGATAVSVHLKGTPERLVLTIADDGRGFDVEAASGGLGLISMEERVEQVGGTLRIRSQPGVGTHLEVSTPLQTATAVAASAV
jgi:signal transduction histidine kinase